MASLKVQDVLNALGRVHNPMTTDVLYEVAIKTGTIEADDNVLTSTAHGLAVGDAFRFASLTGGTGAAINTTYWVITVPNANTLTFSATKGGSAVDVTVDATAFALVKVSISSASLTNAQKQGIDDADSGRVTLA